MSVEVPNGWDNEKLPLAGLIDVVRFAVADARPFNEGFLPYTFTVREAELKPRGSSGTQLNRLLRSDARGRRSELHVKIGRKKVAIEDAWARYKDEADNFLKTPLDQWEHIEAWRCKAQKYLSIAGEWAIIEASYSYQRYGTNPPSHVASLAIQRSLTPRVVAVHQSATGTLHSRRGKSEDAIVVESRPDVGLAYHNIRRVDGWQQALQERLNPRFPFTDLTAEGCWNLLEWSLSPEDLVTGVDDRLRACVIQPVP